jgi:hypothetical protein
MIVRGKQQRGWREEFEEAKRDPMVRRAIIANLESAAAEAEQRGMHGSGAFAAKQDAQLLHLMVTVLLVEDSQLIEAERQLQEVPADRCLSGHISALRHEAVAALDAARARRDGSMPMR